MFEHVSRLNDDLTRIRNFAFWTKLDINISAKNYIMYRSLGYHFESELFLTFPSSLS